MVRECVLSDNYGNGSLLTLEVRKHVFQHGVEDAVGLKDAKRDLKQFELTRCYAPLLHMLRLVLHSRLPAPPYDEQDGNPVNLTGREGCERIYRVSQTGVCMYTAPASPWRVVPCGQGYGICPRWQR
jgi:hypothetical protein